MTLIGRPSRPPLPIPSSQVATQNHPIRLSERSMLRSAPASELSVAMPRTCISRNNLTMYGESGVRKSCRRLTARLRISRLARYGY